MDRNCYLDNIEITQAKSLSARRAWIEIKLAKTSRTENEVALRKESVDRNDTMQIVVVIVYTVALRKESVDRN